jgi:hypothetical protein
MLPLRRAIGIRNLARVVGDEIVLVVDLSRRLERLVYVGRNICVRIYETAERERLDDNLLQKIRNTTTLAV